MGKSKDLSIGEILDELVGHCAYDMGCISSGIHDTLRCSELRSMLERFDTTTYRVECAKWARKYRLSDKAIKEGYGVEDVMEFFKWLENT